MTENKKNSVSQTLILNYAGMNFGGIENYFSKIIGYGLEKGYRIIWLTTRECAQNSNYKNITNDYRVEKVYIQFGIHWRIDVDLGLCNDEKISMISCEPIIFLKGEQLREKNKHVQCFKHYLVLPHFTGNAYYPERFFSTKVIQNICFKYMKRVVEYLNENDCIRAFSLKHLEAYEKNYGIVIPGKQNKILGSIRQLIEFDRDMISRKADIREQVFSIIACARFDFPHKGFMLGLLDVYTQLKEKYKQLRLVIVGYGEGLSEIETRLNAMPQEVKDSVVLTGPLSPQKLKQQFLESHLNIGLAGALLDGVYCNVPSLLVRHYTYDCETYGFVHEIEGGLLRTDEGQEIVDYIEKSITMSSERYIELCTRTYEYAKKRRPYNPGYIFEQSNNSNLPVPKKMSGFQAKLLNFFCFIKQRVFSVSGYDEV